MFFKLRKETWDQRYERSNILKPENFQKPGLTFVLELGALPVPLRLCIPCQGTQPTPAAETREETAADRKCSLDLYGGWAAMSEQPDECSVIDLRIWGPPDAAGKRVWGFCGDLHCIYCKWAVRKGTRWMGAGCINSSPQPCKKHWMPHRRIWINGFPTSLAR